MQVALEYVGQQRTAKRYVRMPHNNPGFDIHVGPDEDPL
jgi:hypothetical protein